MTAPDDGPPPAGRSALPAREMVMGVVLLAVIAAVGMSGVFFGTHDLDRLRDWISGGDQGFVSMAIAVAVFVGLSFIGVPQVLMVAAAVVAFGPWAGFMISWIGKLIACVAGFAVGKRFGARILKRYSSDKVERAMAALAKGGLIACAVVRLVPTVPSIIVNLAAGATPIKWRDFIIGSALGNIPKTALIAFAGDAAIKGLQGHVAYLWIGGGLVLLAWALLAWAGKRLMRGEAVPPTSPSPAPADRG